MVLDRKASGGFQQEGGLWEPLQGREGAKARLQEGKKGRAEEEPGGMFRGMGEGRELAQNNSPKFMVRAEKRTRVALGRPGREGDFIF